MYQKPSIPKGTRDFLPREVARREYIFNTIKTQFKRFGFQPIETPSFEKRETLLGKYGEEGDRLIFRILNSGEKMKKADIQALENDNLAAFANSISEKALRYDLTVPFARFVVQHQNEITFPFKRYQIQPVWRADRPQHGRYQEFYQCDADVVGSDSLLYELECVQLFDEVLSRLRVPDFTVKINNRKILSGLTEVCGASDKLIDFVIALDKLDKIGKEGVIKEWQERGITGQSIAIVQPILDFYGTFDKKIQVVKELLAQSEIGQLGISELEFLFKQVSNIGLKSAKIEFDVTLARGLNYYTGAIFEVVVNGVNMGSICGGGRYDDLTGLFGLPGVSGVGISFGADRIYDVLNMLDLYPEELNHGLTLLFTNFGEQEQRYCLGLLKKVRELGLDAELYPTYEAKIKKQLKYADDRRAKFVVLVGESEMSKGVLKLKNMQTGQQEELSESDFFAFCLKQ
jgi:histidyl-tRNA synthetase